MRIDEIGQWEAFLGVAKLGNFSRASRSLKIPVAQVSKRVAKLESQLNVRLFQRTTRVVTLTNEGKVLLPKITSILEDLREAESCFEGSRELSGRVSVTAVPFVAHKLLIPVLGEFMALHPKLHLELDVSERFRNLVDQRFDLALRIETPKDSDYVYRKLLPNDLVLCASPSYLERNPMRLKTPADLASHEILMLEVHRKCQFVGQAHQLGDFASAKKITCENGAFLTDLALNGFGVLVRSIWDVRDHFKSGRLVPVLEKHRLETFGHIHAVVPNKRFLAPRVRALWDFLVVKSESWAREISRRKGE